MFFSPLIMKKAAMNKIISFALNGKFQYHRMITVVLEVSILYFCRCLLLQLLGMKWSNLKILDFFFFIFHPFIVPDLFDLMEQLISVFYCFVFITSVGCWLVVLLIWFPSFILYNWSPIKSLCFIYWYCRGILVVKKSSAYEPLCTAGL